MIFLSMFCNEASAIASSNTNPLSDPNNSNTPNTTNKKSSSSSSPSGSLDFNTKMLLVIFSIFILLFVIILLIIGHFTWFAEIRKKLEQEWEEELQEMESKRIAKTILSEMKNPFSGNNQDLDHENNDLNDYSLEYNTGMRRDSLDSAGCTLGRCVPPHHSILCPNNPNVPNLHDPFPILESNFVDYKDYEEGYGSNNRSSTEWMNLDSSVRVSGPIPMRDSRMHQYKSHCNFSTGCLIPKLPMTPITPDPNDIERGNNTSNNNSIKSPEMSNFDISKLDMF